MLKPSPEMARPRVQPVLSDGRISLHVLLCMIVYVMNKSWLLLGTLPSGINLKCIQGESSGSLFYYELWNWNCDPPILVTMAERSFHTNHYSDFVRKTNQSWVSTSLHSNLMFTLISSSGCQIISKTCVVPNCINELILDTCSLVNKSRSHLLHRKR